MQHPEKPATLPNRARRRARDEPEETRKSALPTSDDGTSPSPRRRGSVPPGAAPTPRSPCVARSAQKSRLHGSRPALDARASSSRYLSACASRVDGHRPHPQRAHRHPPPTARPDEDQRLTTPGMLTIDRRTARSDVPRRLTPSPRNTSPTGPARSDGDDRAGCGQHGQLRQGGPNPGVHQHRQPAQRGQPDQPGLRGHPRCMADPGKRGQRGRPGQRGERPTGLPGLGPHHCQHAHRGSVPTARPTTRAATCPRRAHRRQTLATRHVAGEDAWCRHAPCWSVHHAGRHRAVARHIRGHRVRPVLRKSHRSAGDRTSSWLQIHEVSSRMSEGIVADLLGDASGGVFAGPGRRSPEGVSTSSGCGSLNSTSVSHRERRERGGGKTRGPPMRDAPFRSRARILVPRLRGACRPRPDLHPRVPHHVGGARGSGREAAEMRMPASERRGPRRATAARPDRRLQPPASARQAR
jgi:hypothetical protein